jgi:disulfide bond formation protein DsbB
MMAQPPTWFMLAIPLFALVLLPLMALLVAGIIHPRTRPFALFSLIAVLAVGFGSVGWLSVSHQPVQQTILMSPETSGHWIDENTWHGGNPEYTSQTSYKHSYRVGGFSFVSLAVIVAVGIGIISMLKKGGPALGAFGMVAAIFASVMGLYFVSGSSQVSHREVPLSHRQGPITHRGPITYYDSSPMPPVPVVPPSPPGISLAHETASAELVSMVTEKEQAAQADSAEVHSAEVPSPEASSSDEAAEATDTLTAEDSAASHEDHAASHESEADALKDMAALEGVDAKQLAEALDPPDVAVPQPAPPEWINIPSQRVGNVTRRVVSEGPHQTADVADKRVQQKIGEAVHEYLSELIAEETHADVVVPQLSELGIAPRWIRDNVVAEQYYASTDSSVASDMQTVYVLLEFDPRDTDVLVESWHAKARKGRVSQVALVASSLLAMLGGSWGLLKLDTATKGYYTKRLFIGVPLAIIGGLALLGLMVA